MSLLSRRDEQINSDNFVQTSVGLLPSQVMVSEDEDGRLLRLQVLSKRGIAMLIRHITAPSQHLCGYALMPPDGPDLYNLLVADVYVTYQGYGTRDVSWRWMNSRRQLISLGKVTPGDEADYWVGFDLMDRPDMSREDATKLLLDFTVALHESSADS